MASLASSVPFRFLISLVEIWQLIRRQQIICIVSRPIRDLPYSKIAQLVVTNWRSLSWKSRRREQFTNCWTAKWKLSEWIYRGLRIISLTRSRAIRESTEEICRRFVYSSETFRYLCGFWNPHSELNCQNIFTWTTPHLQRIIIYWNSSGLQLTQMKTRPRKNSLRPNHSVFWPASGRKSRWKMTANQETTTIVFRPIRDKKSEVGLVFSAVSWVKMKNLQRSKQAHFIVSRLRSRWKYSGIVAS